MKKLLLFLLLILPCTGFSQETNTTKIFLIRHAQTMNVDSGERVLSEEGRATAERWSSVLKDEPIEMIYSTDYKRTQATATPVASSKGGLSIISYDPDNFDLEELLVEVQGKTVLIVGHSGTTPNTVNSLLDEKKFEVIEANNHGNLYIVTFQSKGQASATLIHID